MIVLIGGSSHTGKTLLAQRLLEKYGYPYLSMDHLKMGLIRSGYCSLTPVTGADEMMAYLWPVVREIVKTNIENGQNLIVEGCYLPFTYKQDFSQEYLKDIRYVCLIFSPAYVENHYEEIMAYESVVENRGINEDGYPSKELLLEENAYHLSQCERYGCGYILIDDKYDVDFTL